MHRPQTIEFCTLVIFCIRSSGMTMSRMVIDDKLWKQLEGLLPKRTKDGRPANDSLFIEAVCWVIRTGAPWRDMPGEYGPWKTVYNRYNRWCKKGEFDLILLILKKDGDHKWHMIDDSTIRVHQHAAGARGGQDQQEHLGYHCASG